MNIKEALLQAIQQLEPHSDSAETDAIYLLTHILNTNTAWLFLHNHESLSPTQEQKFFHWVQQRCDGMPIAYLTETRGFWSLDLKINKEVLIPRPETELLVELALKLLPETSCQIADLGTGSGAIALSLASERPAWHIDAVDFSSNALIIAKANAKNLELTNIDFYQGSWCEALPHKHYDAIISNPPYLAANDPHLQTGDLRFEPQTALTPGPTGLEAYQSIIQQAKHYLKPQGLLILEHGYNQREDLIQLLNQGHYQNIQIFDDYQSLPRVLIAKNF